MSLLDRLKQLFADARAAGGTTDTDAAPAHSPAPVDSTPILERRRTGRTNAREGTRILVIDDSPTIVALLKRMLIQNDYAPLEALDAESGLELAFNELPDLIFLDIVLPGMDGFSALRALRRDPRTRSIPVVILSSSNQEKDISRSFETGVNSYVVKPVQLDDYMDKVSAVGRYWNSVNERAIEA
jgi:CheY-like chemotaxis protein